MDSINLDTFSDGYIKVQYVSLSQAEMDQSQEQYHRLELIGIVSAGQNSVPADDKNDRSVSGPVSHLSTRTDDQHRVCQTSEYSNGGGDKY